MRKLSRLSVFLVLAILVSGCTTPRMGDVDRKRRLQLEDRILTGKRFGEVLQAMKLDFEALNSVDEPAGALAGFSYCRREGTNKEEVVIWLARSERLSIPTAERTFERLKDVRVLGTTKKLLPRPDLSTPERAMASVVRCFQEMDPNSLWYTLATQLRQKLAAIEDSEKIAVAILRTWLWQHKLPRPEQWRIISIERKSPGFCVISVELSEQGDKSKTTRKVYPLVKEGTVWKLLRLE